MPSFMSVLFSFVDSSIESIVLPLHSDMHELGIVMKFFRLPNQPRANPWCADIELHIIYGTYAESSQGKPMLYFRSRKETI